MQPLPYKSLWTTFSRLSWSVKALGASGLALAVGFLLGGAAIGPVLSDHSPDNDEALRTRFERRTIDPQGHYPEPSPYRSATPDFGPNQGPALGAYAKKQAQRESHGRGAPSRPLSAEAAESYGSAAVPESHSSTAAAPVTHYRPPALHSGAAY